MAQPAPAPFVVPVGQTVHPIGTPYDFDEGVDPINAMLQTQGLPPSAKDVQRIIDYKWSHFNIPQTTKRISELVKAGSRSAQRKAHLAEM